MKLYFVTSTVVNLAIPFLSATAHARPMASVETFLRGSIDLHNDTVTLPLRHGILRDGRDVFFALTESSDAAEARRLGIGYAPELQAAMEARGARRAIRDEHGRLVFLEGTVNFAPERRLVPGVLPQAFPPVGFQPGSVGDAAYSPLFSVENRSGPTVYNAPILAMGLGIREISYCNGNVDYGKVHDKVVSICPERGTVTLKLSRGFAGGKQVVYLSFDANDPMAATMESSTHAPRLGELMGSGATLEIFAVANGTLGRNSPDRQGFESALRGEGAPLNVLEGVPSTSRGYSPIWDLFLGEWSRSAIADGQRRRLTSEREFENAVARGFLTGPMGGSFASTGILVNCPVVGVIH